MHEGMQTPWGKAQTVTVLCDGIGFASTASHGGVKLDRKHNAEVPEYMRSAGGWYEEDCQWAIPFVVFEFELLLFGSAATRKTIQDKGHIDTFRSWNPDAYEKFFNVMLKPGESFIRDEKLFYAEHAEDWLVNSAFGEWQNGVEKGYIGACATKGGRSLLNGTTTPPERFFLVPASEYAQRGKFSFVIDLERHKETTDFTKLGSKPV